VRSTPRPTHVALPGRPRPPLLIVLVLALITAASVSVPGAASAAQTRLLLRSFGAATSTVPDPAPLSNPQGEAARRR